MLFRNDLQKNRYSLFLDVDNHFVIDSITVLELRPKINDCIPASSSTKRVSIKLILLLFILLKPLRHIVWPLLSPGYLYWQTRANSISFPSVDWTLYTLPTHGTTCLKLFFPHFLTITMRKLWQSIRSVMPRNKPLFA